MMWPSQARHGSPCWVNLAARSLDEAQDFYGAVLGWTWRPTQLGEEFRTALSDGWPVAGVGQLASRLGVAVAWTPFFAVEKADAIAARIQERGGTVGVGPLAFAQGRAALAADRDGAVFGFWEGAVLPGWAVGRGSAPAWLELRTRDAFAAAMFYGDIFGWASEDSTCTVDYEHDEVIVREAERKVATLRGGAVEAAPDPKVRPRWYVHFRVADVDAAVAAARAAGGTVAIPPATSSAGRQATLCDPDGGLFTVTTA